MKEVKVLWQHWWWRLTVQASIKNFRRFWDSNHNFKSSFCIFFVHRRTSEHSSRQRYGSGVSMVISTAGSSAWPTIEALPIPTEWNGLKTWNTHTHTLRLGRNPSWPLQSWPQRDCECDRWGLRVARAILTAPLWQSVNTKQFRSAWKIDPR